MTAHRTITAAANTHWVRGFFFFLVLAAAAGCGRPARGPATGADGHYIEQVPFYEQGEGSCGPAALASVLGYWGRPQPIEQIRAAVYSPRLRGSLPMDLERHARASGMRVFSASGTLDALRVAVRSDEPVICLLDLGFWVFSQPHYVVVIGFDDARQTLAVHDGVTPGRIMAAAAFDRAWSRAGRWMMVIRPGEKNDSRE